jgi:hypothetical protein
VIGVNVVFWPYFERLEYRMGFFEDAFPRNSCNWYHSFADFHDEANGAIVVINGAAADAVTETRDKQMRVLNDQLRAFRWVMLVSIGDEGSGQHLEWIDHPNCSIWVYDPKPGKHDAFHHLPAGTIQQVPELFPRCSQWKIFDWSWSGSIRDINWDAAIRALPGHGSYYDSHLGYEGYVQLLADSKIVPCRPSWTSPETCRVYDALECGAIPIVGILPGENPPGHYWWRDFNFDWPNFWTGVLGEKPPFPVISSPDQLADAVMAALADWPNNMDRCAIWWADYKKRLKETLQFEVRRLQG